jgi:hypothetical protein
MDTIHALFRTPCSFKNQEDNKLKVKLLRVYVNCLKQFYDFHVKIVYMLDLDSVMLYNSRGVKYSHKLIWKFM